MTSRRVVFLSVMVACHSHLPHAFIFHLHSVHLSFLSYDVCSNLTKAHTGVQYSLRTHYICTYHTHLESICGNYFRYCATFPLQNETLGDINNTPCFPILQKKPSNSQKKPSNLQQLSCTLNACLEKCSKGQCYLKCVPYLPTHMNLQIL